MADMLETTRPFFSLPAPSSGWSTTPIDAARSPISQTASHAAAWDFSPTARRGLEGPSAQLRRVLADSGRRLLLRHFLVQLGKVLDEQEHVLEVLEASPTWSLESLNRQFYAVRTAAEGLELRNLARVAGRAEVLVNLLTSGELVYGPNHGVVIRETHRLLRKLVSKVVETDSDDACYPITQTVWSMHAALDPKLCEYEPGEHSEHSVAQSTKDPSSSGSNHEPDEG